MPFSAFLFVQADSPAVIIKETIKKDLPEGFQRSEFIMEHGFLDFIVPRKDLKEKLGTVLTLLKQ